MFLSTLHPPPSAQLPETMDFTKHSGAVHKITDPLDFCVNTSTLAQLPICSLPGARSLRKKNKKEKLKVHVSVCLSTSLHVDGHV